jgi:ectoine hydroxylase-related dioxygenase (phytanoyl-CoA dioxygenase family)
LTAIDWTDPLIVNQVNDLHRRGWAVLRNVFSPEEMTGHRELLRDYISSTQAKSPGAIDAMPFAAARALASSPAASGSARRAPTGNKPAYSLADAPAEVAAFVRSAWLGEIAARFLGVEALRVLHFAGFIKPGGGPPTPLHQDLSYIPLDTDKVISIWIPLTELTPEMAPLVFAEGSHLHGYLDNPLAGAERFPLVQNGAMRAGDVSLHLGWTLHGALKNSSEKTRESFAICYFADGARIEKRAGGPFIQNILNSCFPGIAPGQLARGPLNPIIYSRRDAESEGARAYRAGESRVKGEG